MKWRDQPDTQANEACKVASGIKSERKIGKFSAYLDHCTSNISHCKCFGDSTGQKPAIDAPHERLPLVPKRSVITIEAYANHQLVVGLGKILFDCLPRDLVQPYVSLVLPKRNHATTVRVVLPAYNEEVALPRLIPRIVQTLAETDWAGPIGAGAGAALGPPRAGFLYDGALARSAVRSTFSSSRPSSFSCSKSRSLLALKNEDP